MKTPHLITLLSLLLLSVAFSVGFFSVAVFADGCEPGYFEYNVSGTFLCVPSLQRVSLSPIYSISAFYNDSSGNVSLSLLCLHPGSCSLNVSFSKPDGSVLASFSDSLGFNNLGVYSVYVRDLGIDYVVVNLSVSSGDYFSSVLFAVEIRRVLPYASYIWSINDVFLRFVFSLFVLSPLVGFLILHRSSEAGIALLVISSLYTPLMAVLGVPPIISLIVSGLLAIIGLIFVASK